MRYFPCAWVIAGAFFFVWRPAWGADNPYAVLATSIPVALSSTALAAQAATIEEPFVSPLGSGKAVIVSGFGKREVPGQPEPEMHEGIDYKLAPGSPVRAARSGKLIFVGFSKMYASRTDKTDQHRFIIIRHADGKSSRYVHLNAARVRPGQEVKAGQVIGISAESDEWTEPVLHFEIRDIQGQPVDPKTLIVEAPKP